MAAAGAGRGGAAAAAGDGSYAYGASGGGRRGSSHDGNSHSSSTNSLHGFSRSGGPQELSVSTTHTGPPSPTIGELLPTSPSLSPSRQPHESDLLMSPLHLPPSSHAASPPIPSGQHLLDM